MITFGRRGGPLLVGLATGAVLVGMVAATQPAELLPAGWATAPGASVTPPAAPTEPPAVPPTVPLLDSLPTAIAPAPVPPTTTRPPAPTTTAARPATTRPAPPPTARPLAKPGVPPVSGGPTAQVVALTNQARASAGCPALRVDARLSAAAQGHSDDMSAHRYFAHDSRDGRTFADRITAAGYPSPGGENIAQGQRDAQEVVTAWLNSPGHRRNIEDCSFTTIGVGLAGADRYWTQDFGR